MFKKDGEIKVYKAGKKIGSEHSDENESNRYTVDDLVKDSEKEEEKVKAKAKEE